VIKRRVRRLGGIVARAAITLAVAAAGGALVLFLTGPNGSISCVDPASAAGSEPVPRWVLAAGGPALVAGLVGAYYGLGAPSVRGRLLRLVFAAAVAAGTFYVVYILLPIDCRP
jgi:hypothetical protein